MNKTLTIKFAETSPSEVDVSIESSDPNDDINEIIALLESTLHSLATGISDDDLEGIEE